MSRTTLLRGGRTADGAGLDVLVVDGTVVEVGDGRPLPDAGAEITELDGDLLVGAFADPHVHLDKALTAAGARNADGTLTGAMTGYRALLDAPTPDVVRRVTTALGLLLAAGVTAVRAHTGCGRLAGTRFVEILADVRARTAGLLDLQIVAHLGGPAPGEGWDRHRQILHEALEAGADLVGGNPSHEERPEEALDALLQVALDHRAGVDLHLDETTDPDVVLLRRLVATAPPEMPVTASHCVSLGSLPAADSAALAADLAHRGIGVVTLPATNLYLQGRGAGTRPRGLPPLDVLLGAGVELAAGSDNLQDPFNPVGSADPLTTAQLLVLAGHLDPAVARDLVGPAARRLMVAPAVGPVVGSAADLVALRGVPGTDAWVGPVRRRVWRSGTLVADSAAGQGTAATAADVLRRGELP